MIAVVRRQTASDERCDGVSARLDPATFAARLN
jgi:hypothetical protein